MSPARKRNSAATDAASGGTAGALKSGELEWKSASQKIVQLGRVVAARRGLSRKRLWPVCLVIHAARCTLRPRMDVAFPVHSYKRSRGEHR